MNKLKPILAKFINLLFPPRCHGCRKIDTNSVGLCSACFDKYKEECSSVCPICGKQAAECVCGISKYSTSFLGNKRALSLTFFKGYSSDSTRLTEKLIYSYKRNYNKDLTDLFARDIAARLIKLMTESGEKIENWIITYPPRTPKNMIKYGFDHAEKTAKRISYYTGITCDKIIYRAGGSEQKTLHASERALNAEFSMFIMKRKAVMGKSIILFDDVITTGATVRTASDLLLDAGAAAVFPISIAKTPPLSKQLLF